MTLAATDVHYLSDTEARAAAVVFDGWASAVATAEHAEIAHFQLAEPYAIN